MTASSGRLPWQHLVLALAVVAVWGTNFVVIRWALDSLPPLLFAVLRFSFVFLPAAFFVKRPNVPWLDLCAYGVLIGVGQFGLLYLAIQSEITPGLASLVVQTQVFFTIFLSMAINGETVARRQWMALIVAFCGIGVIIAHVDASATPLGVIMILGAALSWAAGNLVAKRAGQVNMFAYVIWSSAFAVPPLLVLSVMIEGVDRIETGLAQAGLVAWSAVAWQSIGNSLFGYSAWAWLLARHPASKIVPTALAVPIFGMGASALLLNEGLPPWKLIAAALVILGLTLNIAAARPRR